MGIPARGRQTIIAQRVVQRRNKIYAAFQRSVKGSREPCWQKEQKSSQLNEKTPIERFR